MTWCACWLRILTWKSGLASFWICKSFFIIIHDHAEIYIHAAWFPTIRRSWKSSCPILSHFYYQTRLILWSLALHFLLWRPSHNNSNSNTSLIPIRHRVSTVFLSPLHVIDGFPWYITVCIWPLRFSIWALFSDTLRSLLKNTNHLPSIKNHFCVSHTIIRYLLSSLHKKLDIMWNPKQRMTLACDFNWPRYLGLTCAGFLYCSLTTHVIFSLF